ncbi:hypothetical protein AW928_13580 [Pseudomonas aeruginosa]|nr:hypothetical protein AN399_32060 [Pseudomonas aeruginosa]KXE60416.1 hypothetical protein AW928_13580 [Pseudomonas aeruginosa]KXE62392.1 hypothetical protein AW929_13155 [Pseudomonas aeruginosa]KXE75405.1 hypothetical protein AW931_13170 [Pseudomonas aeruginosa]KXE76833.1 hypothetical protein AW930_13195 [Pseudomonas aeruginosa]
MVESDVVLVGADQQVLPAVVRLDPVDVVHHFVLWMAASQVLQLPAKRLLRDQHVLVLAACRCPEDDIAVAAQVAATGPAGR